MPRVGDFVVLRRRTVFGIRDGSVKEQKAWQTVRRRGAGPQREGPVACIGRGMRTIIRPGETPWFAG